VTTVAPVTHDGQPAMSPLLIPRPYRVIDKISEAEDIVTLHVVPVDGSLPQFSPAQVSMLGAFGFGEAAISISTATHNRDHHGYTIRRAGPISGALVDTRVGGTITVRGPFGTPWPMEDITTDQLLIVGGGLGIAPLRAAIESAVGRRNEFDRIVVAYGAKAPDVLLYGHDLDRWSQNGAEVALIVDRGDDEWTGPVGVVPDLFGKDRPVDLDWANTSVFICGPDVMMHFAATALVRLGVTTDHIWLTLERNMQCGNALCGHCQLGPFIVCRDGPVVNYQDIAPFQRVDQL
jgi:NAD(P)H-flavin reductase